MPYFQIRSRMGSSATHCTAIAAFGVVNILSTTLEDELCCRCSPFAIADQLPLSIFVQFLELQGLCLQVWPFPGPK